MNQVKFIQKNLNEAIPCQGITVRTNNAKEMTAGQENSTAKIGSLWQAFQNQFGKNINEKTQVYGVYHNYENDVHGDFDVTACFAVNKKDLTSELPTITIPTGEYLVFSKQGSMPQAVIEAWNEVWHYFEHANCQHSRKYDVDFEKYVSSNTIEVYIGIN
ncbi:MAG: AraC family transcriptional regulator [Gammaproteobacteria bacterium]|nr:MAG: AraC family transcriptional regulator [Gammaproteobacteria bacterium]